MKLTNSQIQFIDRYLQNSDVIFVDVRAEITDHIASAIEAKITNENLDFDDAFKTYMIKNKKSLLANNGKFFPQYFAAFIHFIKTLYQPFNLVLAALLYIAFHYGIPLLHSEIVFETIKKGLFLSVFIFFIVQFVYSFFISKKRYLYVEKTGFILFIIYYLNLFTNGFYSERMVSVNSLFLSVFLFFAFVIHYIKTIKKFKKIVI
jgi:hypothetical protein